MDSSTITLVRSGSTAAFLDPTAPAASLAAEVTIPSQIGSVHLVRQIGRGGMGVVWLGHDEMLGRDVAVKFLLDAVRSPDDPHFKGFIEGARAAAAVKHPGLTAVFQADVIEGVPFLVMEYINGLTLADVMRRHGPLKPELAIAIMLKVCEAVAELHDHGIVHRDIKPSNIMLNAAGEVFVTDFGLACGRVPIGAALTGQTLAGTPAYMAPEMFDGIVSLKTDVYALGVVFWESLSGRLPTELNSPDAMLRTIDDEICEMRREHVDAIERMIKSNPRFRLKSARQVNQTLSTLDKTRAGKSDLAQLIQAGTKSPPAERDRDGSSYHDQLSLMASKKRALNDDLSPRGAHHDSLRTTAGTLLGSIPCVNCDYDLRGLHSSESCPECQTSIKESLFDNRLLFSDAQWLRTIIKGCQFARLTIAWALFAPPFVFVLRILAGPNSAGSLLVNVAAIASGIGLLGFTAWHLSSQEPTINTGETNRGWQGFGFLASTCLALVATMAQSAGYASHVFFLAWTTAILAIIFVYGMRLAALARRIPRTSLVRSQHIIGLLLAAVVIALVLFVSVGESDADITFVSMLVGIGGYLAFLGLQESNLHGYVRAFRTVSKLAKPQPELVKQSDC